MTVLTWTKIDPRDTEYNDQTADLLAGHWAEIGPDGTDWTVTIIRAELPYCDQLTVCETKATSEAHAKAVVLAWVSNYHRHAVRIISDEIGFAWQCRECLAHGLDIAPVIADVMEDAIEHAQGGCEDLWNEWLVGAR